MQYDMCTCRSAMLWKSLNSRSRSSDVLLLTSSPSLMAPYTHTHTHSVYYYFRCGRINLTPSSSILSIFLFLFSVRCLFLACLRSSSCPSVSGPPLLLLPSSPSPPPPLPNKPCSYTQRESKVHPHLLTPSYPHTNHLKDLLKLLPQFRHLVKSLLLQAPPPTPLVGGACTTTSF